MKHIPAVNISALKAFSQYFFSIKFFILLILALMPAHSFATGLINQGSIGPIKIEFILFSMTLLGVALFHHHTLKVSLIGLSSILLYKFGFTDFNFISHLGHEWMILINLLGLLLGFAILARHFEESGVPQMLPKYLPNDWKGGFCLLILIALMSMFLDNIAAAIIGGTIALVVFEKKVHIGYIIAIVAASNAGGSGSVIGDTTTTMMWIDGVNAFDVVHAYYAAIPAIILFSIVASMQQDRYHRITKDAPAHIKIDFNKLFVVGLILAGAILANVYLDFPALGVWIAILAGGLITRTPWHDLPGALKGSVFLLSLVLSASVMPVDELPVASWQNTFSMGFISAVFDNIPLTKLALAQGGYDWGVLAYAVGFGGSMMWFGSSAGVAVSAIFPEAKSVWFWVKNSWHVVLAYIIGFFILLYFIGWNPHAPHKIKALPQMELLQGH
jgi:Na+/H+ antiporter NhaD/arsenite permease-like protein